MHRAVLPSCPSPSMHAQYGWSVMFSLCRGCWDYIDLHKRFRSDSLFSTSICLSSCVAPFYDSFAIFHPLSEAYFQVCTCHLICYYLNRFMCNLLLSAVVSKNRVQKYAFIFICHHLYVLRILNSLFFLSACINIQKGVVYSYVNFRFPKVALSGCKSSPFSF